MDMDTDPGAMPSTPSKKEWDAINRKLVEAESRIIELEGRLQTPHITSKTIDALNIDELKKLCLEMDSTNKALKQQIQTISLEKADTVEQLTKKMDLVMHEKDRQIKRHEALGEQPRPLGNQQNSKEGKQIRMAISAETAKNFDPKKLPKVPKSKDDETFLKDAFANAQFFKRLHQDQLRKIIDCMEKKKLKSNVEIIKEGNDGSFLYILTEGSVMVSTQKDGDVAELTTGQIFGELALLYNCRRMASVRTKSDVTFFQLDRRYYQGIVQSTGAQKDESKYNLLKQVPKLKELPSSKLRKICDCLEDEKFNNNDCIIKQGTTGDTFYIISEGSVKVTKNQSGSKEEEVAQLQKGAYFGELALQSEEKRSANIYAIGEVTCYSLDRHAFISLIGRLDDDHTEKVEKIKDPEKKSLSGGLENAKIEDARVLKSLGQGGFGDVKLVYFVAAGVEKKPYALKCVQKCRIVQYGQQRHIMDEKNILLQMRSPFLLSLHMTFRDNKQVYLLTDAYLGGDLWRLLHARGPFPDTVARFYIGCVVEAFDYLHQRGIVYRDLKPENLMLDINGYLRLVDLGFAKKVPIGNKTWTFCGTPEYIPPEVIANTGHTLSADYWSLGILVYELLTRKTPFRAKDDLTIYENILRGIHSVQFSYRVSRKAEMLIKSLCRQEASERLGYQKAGISDIKKHKWFGGFDWDGFNKQGVPAPILPDVRDPMENCEKSTKLDPMSHIPSENSGWDNDF